MQKIRIICLSDTHGFHKKVKVPDGDILIHAGDISIKGEIIEVKNFINWFGNQPHKHKIFINGNHELYVSKLGNLTKLLVDEHNKVNKTNIVYLEEESIVLNGLKFYGSPRTIEFFNWAYMYEERHAKRIWDRVPNDVDVLITHQPPLNKLDYVIRPNADGNHHVGCKELLSKVLEIKPLLHVYGHLHEDGCKYIKGVNTTYVNASICDEEYNIGRKPIIVDIDKESKSVTVVEL